MNDHKDVCNEEVVVEFETAPANNTGGSENDPRDQAGGETRRKGPYAVHGIFSRHPWRILSKCGEDMKKLSATERMLFEHYKPTDAFKNLFWIGRGRAFFGVF